MLSFIASNGMPKLLRMSRLEATAKAIYARGQILISRMKAPGLPSSRTGLLPSSPLRTVHESFPSHSSSPSNASFGETRFRDRNALVVSPVMALWMKENAILGALRTTHRAGNAVVKAPARDPSDFCIAHSAEPALFMPEKAKRASTPKRFLHMGSFAFLEVGFIGRVVGVRVTFDFNVSLDGCATGVVQPNLAWLPFVIARFTEEGPVTTTPQRKVLLFAPAGGLVRVSSSCPSPQTREDVVIHACKRACTHHVPMIVSPTPDFGVEFMDQIGGRHAERGFDGLPDAVHEGFNVLLGRLDEQFPVGILAHVLSEEIKTFLHVGDDRLRGRKFQPSCLQKLLDEGLDFSFQ